MDFLFFCHFLDGDYWASISLYSRLYQMWMMKVIVDSQKLYLMISLLRSILSNGKEEQDFFVCFCWYFSLLWNLFNCLNENLFFISFFFCWNFLNISYWMVIRRVGIPVKVIVIQVSWAVWEGRLCDGLTGMVIDRAIMCVSVYSQLLMCTVLASMLMDSLHGDVW